MTDDLLVWLRAQLDEDERLATGAVGGWITKGPHPHDRTSVGSHMARWDPARVLREVEAKRRLAELHADDPEIEDGPACGVCSWRDDMEELQGEWPCLTARLLALPYADRPGYRQEWVP